MRNTILLLALLYPLCLQAQTRRMTNPEQGRSFTVENQYMGVMPLLQEAERYFKRFDYEKAFFTLETAVSRNPNSAEALLARAKFKKTIGMIVEAQIDYDKAYRINPDVADLYGYNGNTGLQRIISIEPETAILGLTKDQKLLYYHEAIDKLFLDEWILEEEENMLRSALNTIDEGRLNAARVMLETTLESYPKLSMAYNLLGLINYQQETFEEAEFQFDKASRLDPTAAIPKYNLGTLALDRGDYKSAEKLFTTAISLNENLTKAYFSRAMSFKAAGKFDKAIEDYNTIIEKKGSFYVEAYLNRGLTKMMAGDFVGAFMDLNQIIKEYPNIPELRKNRANLFMLYGSRALAIEEYTEAIKLDYNYAQAYYNRALAHLQLYDKVSACDDLEKAIAIGYKRAEEMLGYFCSH